LASKRDYLREGISLAAVWIVLNWLLDFLALLPFTKRTLPRYLAMQNRGNAHDTRT
jgi:hypothetical protein